MGARRLKTGAAPRSNRFCENLAHFLLRISEANASVAGEPERRNRGGQA
jgi:hypothetical protein